MTEPTAPADLQPPPVEDPHGAIIEVVERHTGDKYPYSGPASVLCPNHLRINGVAVWATYDNPVRVREVTIDGAGARPFAVTVQLLARALHVGATPAFDPAALGAVESTAAAVVEIPDTAGLKAGRELDLPYVWLNWQRIYIDGPIIVGELTTDRIGLPAAMVTLTLLCRQFTVDDEPFLPLP